MSIDEIVSLLHEASLDRPPSPICAKWGEHPRPNEYIAFEHAGIQAALSRAIDRLGSEPECWGIMAKSLTALNMRLIALDAPVLRIMPYTEFLTLVLEATNMEGAN